MSLETTLAQGRRKREILMTSECDIVRPADQVFDTTTGEYISPDNTIVYRGKCHFKSWSALGQRIGNVAGRELTLMMYEVLLPYWTQDHAIGESDIVYLTKSADTWAIGEPLPVVSAEFSMDRTCRHVTVNYLPRGDVQYG